MLLSGVSVVGSGVIVVRVSVVVDSWIFSEVLCLWWWVFFMGLVFKRGGVCVSWCR